MSTSKSMMVKGDLWVHFQGRTFIYETEKKIFGKAGKVKSGKGLILAPMPGKVTKVLKKTDEAVKSGDVLLVMEAMKMEYTLKADLDGAIAEINCQAGDQVALGKLLVRIG